jgi:ribosomal protein S27E
MASKRIVMTEQGLTVCPSCMNHIELSSEALSKVTCPFCGEGLVNARRADGDIFGKGVASALKSSRSTALAAMLGASLSMAACTGGNGPQPEPVYGAPPIEEDMDRSNSTSPDMEVDMGENSMPQPEYGVPAVEEDMGVDMNENNLAVPEYGVPPTDME